MSFSKSFRAVLGLASLALALAPAKAQDIWHVDCTNCPGPGTGSQDNPFCTIQQGIIAAVPGDTVVVADCVYAGPGNRDLDFGGKLITVRSANGPENCIIDCQGTENDPHRGFHFHSGETSEAVVDGFTIINGFVTFGVTNAQHGGGMSIEGSSPTVTNCVFIGNRAPNGSGGGIFNSGSSPTVTNTVFRENSALGSGGLYNISASNATITNCTFIGNTSASSGGGMGTAASNPTVTNCTFSGNSANDGGAMVNFFGSSPTVTNCIMWGNSPNSISGSGTPSVTYSDVEDGFSGEGNIDTDPQFADPASGDLHLLSGSLCVDAGNNSGVSNGFTTDLDGNPRFVDDPDTLDTGVGPGPVVDLGAYEFPHGNLLTFESDGESATWPEVGGALSYNMYQGGFLELVDSDGDGLPDTGYGQCANDLDPDTSDTLFVDVEIPVPGAGFFYLMSVLLSNGVEAFLGATSDGQLREVLDPCP